VIWRLVVKRRIDVVVYVEAVKAHVCIVTALKKKRIRSRNVY